jgi:hypothetical protein
VTTLPLTYSGATHLIHAAGKILIGHNTYTGTGCLQYYDPGEEAAGPTGVTNIDVAKLAYDDSTGRIFFINNTNTFYIDTSLDIGLWSAVEIASGPAPGADMVLYNGNVYAVNTDYVEPYDNILYIIDAGTAECTDTINLNDGAPSGDEDGLTKLGVDPVRGRLYFTDTWNGNIYSCNTEGTNIIYETTTSGAAGPIYFSGSSAYVLTGAGTMGVHMFNVENPGTTTHFIGSADISAQYMVFTDKNRAFVTHYTYGVYEFDPENTMSDFSILPDTDPSDKTGFQDIIYYQEKLYTTINNFPNESYLMIIEDF